MSQLARFQKRINEVIPLTRCLEVNLDAYDGRTLRVSAPLEPNRNHQMTAFGGSLYAVAVVSAWGLVELQLEDAGLVGRVVVQSGDITYLGPVADDFFAVCELPDAPLVARFHKTLARYGKGRLNLVANLYAGASGDVAGKEPLAVFKGRFVIQDAHTAPVVGSDRF